MLKHCISKISFLTCIAEFENPTEATVFLNRQTPDLIFLDVEMPKMSGIDFLKSMPNPKPCVILVSGEKKYAYEGFEQNIVDYLSKPFTFDRFHRAVQKAQEIFDNKHTAIEDTFLLRTNTAWRKIEYKNVYYVEAQADYVAFFVADGGTELRRHLVHIRMCDAEKILNRDFFFRVHRSYIVNAYKVEGFIGELIHIGGISFRVGLTYKSKILELYRIFGNEAYLH
jgi:DNA-binding LytR/AlgR family response regulator